jgi:hypothetical protein
VLGGVAGVSFASLNSGDITRTTEVSPLGDDPVLGATFDWSGMAIGAGYARRLTDRLSLGGQIKFVSEGMSDARISWMALDLGTQFQTGIYGLMIGASIHNVGPSSRMKGALVRRKINAEDFSEQRTAVEFDTRETELPTLFRFSVGSDLYGSASSLFGQEGGPHRLVGELAVSDAIDTDVQAALGLEYGFRNLVFLRGGKRFYNDGRDAGEDNTATYGLSGGLGIRLPVARRALRFDYAYTSLGTQLQNVQVFSFEFGR